MRGSLVSSKIVELNQGFSLTKGRQNEKKVHSIVTTAGLQMDTIEKKNCYRRLYFSSTN
jgi:hypothetical protein